jgi:hypothetical protein
MDAATAPAATSPAAASIGKPFILIDLTTLPWVYRFPSSKA